MNVIELFGVIGSPGCTAAEVKAELASFDDSEELVVKIDSRGGCVKAGNAMHAAFAEYAGPKRAVVESFAGSIASYLLTAFDDVEITPNGYVMIHNPSMKTDGDDDDHERNAKLIASVKENMVEAYSQKTRKSPAAIRKMMKAETFFSAQEALDAGIVSSIRGQSKTTRLSEAVTNSMPFFVVASLRPAIGKNQLPSEELTMADDLKPVAATPSEIESAFPEMDADFVLSCIKKEMPMSAVASSAAKAMQEENGKLRAEVDELKVKLDEAEAKVAAAEEASEQATSAQADATANQAIPVGGNDVPISAKSRWDQAVQACVERGMNRQKASSEANRKNPGLRAEMLAEING